MSLLDQKSKTIEVYAHELFGPDFECVEARLNSQCSVSILVPTLDEVKNLDELFTRLLDCANRNGLDVEIVVADGGSSDGTQAKTAEWARSGPVRLIKCSGIGGLSGDVLEAAQQCTTDVVMVIDADLSHPPEVLPQLVKPILEGTHEMAIGCRYMPGGGTPGWPMHRRLTSRIAGALSWPFADANDPMSGNFAMRRTQLIELGSQATGFKLGLEVLARGGDEFRIHEVPITFVDRVHGISKMSLGESIGCLKQMSSLAGGNSSVGTVTRFAAVGLMGFMLDMLIFLGLLRAGFGIEPAHITGFVAATILNYTLNARWAFRSANQCDEGSGTYRYIQFLVVCVLALFLRGAVLESLISSDTVPALIAILPAIAAATIVNYFGFAYFVFGNRDSRTTNGIRWRVFAIAVVAYSLALRIVFAGIVDLIPEEAYYWNYAMHLDIGYLDHPPMVSWLIWMSTSIFGNNELAVRIPSLMSWGVSAFFVYHLSRNLFDKTVALRAVMLLSILPIYFGMGFLMMPDAPLYAAWAGCLFFLERALLQDRRWSWIGLGVCLGIGMLSKYSIALIGPATLVYLALDPKCRKWFVRPQPYLGVLIAAILFLPVIVWNIQHEWVSFAFQGTRRWSGAYEFSLHLLIGAVIVCLTPLGAAGVLQAMLPRRLGGPDLAQMEISGKRVRLFSLVFTLVPLTVFVLHALQDNPKIHWTGPLWLAAIPLLAYAMINRADIQLSRASRIGQRLWKPSIVALMLFYGGSLYVITIGPPASPRFPHMELPVAWEEMSESISAIATELGAQSGSTPVVIGLHDYFITSEYSFYHPSNTSDHTVGGRGLVGYSGLMWDDWCTPNQVVGRDVVLVDFTSDRLSSKIPEKYFERMGPLQEYEVRKNGYVVGAFFYRIGYSYLAAKSDSSAKQNIVSLNTQGSNLNPLSR
tara:strand:- start:10943 stop:13717 length:2775 start_codon:yes stop_codon:yes gene_type:complete